MQLNTWEPSTDTSNADGLLSFRTLAVLDMAQLTAGLRDGTDAALLEELLFAASMTTDRHGFLFLAEESNQKSRIMTMLLNAVSSHFRLGFMMRDVDPDSVVEREYCIGLTNEAGERVDHQKIRLFVTAKDTLEQLRACNFEQLSTDMEDEQKQSSAAEKKGRWDKHMVWDKPIAPTPSPHQERKGAHFRRMTSKEQCGGLRPEFEGGRVNRKRWQTLVEMAHLKAANNDLIWDMTICIPKHQASQATARHAPGRETMHEM